MSESLFELIDKKASTEEIIAAIDDVWDVDEKKDYYTPLQRVVKEKMSIEIVQALLDAGAYVDGHATEENITDQRREELDEEGIMYAEELQDAEFTALALATQNNQLDVMQTLLDAEADVNLIFGTSGSDLFAAISFANTKEALELLIQNGARVNIVYGEEEPNSVLYEKIHYADMSPECILTLLRAGAVAFGNRSSDDMFDVYLSRHPEIADPNLFRQLWEKNKEERMDEVHREAELNRERFDNEESDWDIF